MTSESNNPQHDPSLPPSAGTEKGNSPPNLPNVKQPRQVNSAALLQGDREIQIVHGEEVYRLSLTRQGKLILHK